MAAKPDRLPIWATLDTFETKIIDGITQQVPNKIPIPSDVQLTGIIYDQYLSRQYINEILHVLSSWVPHLDERYNIGDLHLSVSGEDMVTIAARLGGNWVQRGTQAVGSVTANVWEKLA